MAIHYLDTITISCDEDGCPEVFDGTDDFQATIAAAKADGWKITRDSMGNYIHVCPTCSE
jgi:hypothetical protein